MKKVNRTGYVALRLWIPKETRLQFHLKSLSEGSDMTKKTLEWIERFLEGKLK